MLSGTTGTYYKLLSTRHTYTKYEVIQTPSFDFRDKQKVDYIKDKLKQQDIY